MAKHLPGKVARLISDFLTIGELTKLIEHEMEKRIVARHGLVKLDALLNLVARLKNEIRNVLPPGQKKDKGTAHVDADVDIWMADLQHWPMTIDELINEALRVIEAVRKELSPNLGDGLTVQAAAVSG